MKSRAIRKIAALVIIAALAVTMAFALAACNEGGGGLGSGDIAILVPSADHGWTGAILSNANAWAEEINAEGKYSARVITATGDDAQKSQIEDIAANKNYKAVVILPYSNAVESSMKILASSGIPFIMGYNVVCGILRGLGDSKSPLYFVFVACIINIGVDFLLVGGFGMRAAGAAVATVLSQGISFLAALWFLHRRGFHFEFGRKDIRPDRLLTKQIVKLGAPIALQDALINVSFLIITVIVNQMGVIASASLGVVEKIIVFAMLPPTAIAAAVSTMTAQNYGAGLVRRMTRCLYSGIGMALVFGLSVCLYSQFWPETLTGIFTKDPAVIDMAAGYLRGYSIDCIMVSFVFCINSYFSGQGNSLFPMIHSMIATFLFRIPLSYLFGQLDPTDLQLMGYAPPLSTMVSLLICLWYLRRCRRKRAFNPG